MTTATRLITALAGALAATNTFLISLPGDSIPQTIIIIVGVATAFSSAFALYLGKSA